MNFTITPDTNVSILMCPIEIDNINQISFTDINTQNNYFDTLPSLEVENCTFQRHDNYIRFPACIDEILEYNYVRYKNTHFGDKWFYAFIERMEFINTNCTAIYIKTDVFQSWQFDIVYKPSFIEREHVNDDTIGLHTVPENLETGEYINQGTPVELNYNDFYICVGLSEDILLNNNETAHNSYNGVVSGLTYIILETETDVNRLIFRYNQASKIDAVYSLFMIPKGYVSDISWLTDSTGTFNFQYVGNQDTPFNLGNVEILKPTMIGDINNGYTPKNNKLLTFPFVYLEATNNVGANIVYNYELFTDSSGNYTNQINFKAYGSISPGCNIKVVPQNYKFVPNDNLNEGFNGAKLPVGGWINDVFTNWLTQNGVNIALSSASNILQLASGVQLSKGTSSSVQGASQITSSSLGLADTIASVYEHSLIPNQAEGNTNSSDIIFAMKKSSPSFYKKTIRTEYAEIIDNYFSAYGYKVNALKRPNIAGRRNWNYVRTINLNIEGDIPQSAIEELKNIFNNGVTIWHNPGTFLDYSQSNPII